MVNNQTKKKKTHRSSNRVYIVVLNWNGAADTIECLQSLLADIKTNRTSVVVVDNASSDGSVHTIREWMRENAEELGIDFEELTESELDTASNNSYMTFIQANQNRGYSAGNNIGMRYALRQSDSKFIYILNNDTIVHPNAIKELVKFAHSSPDSGIIGCTIMDYYERDIIECAGGSSYNKWLTLSSPALAGVSLTKALQDKYDLKLDYIYGAAMLLRADMVQKVGLLNEDYFLYYEELDYALRAKHEGYGLAWCKGCIVYHKGGASAGSKSSTNTKKSISSEYHSNLSALKFNRRFHPWKSPLIGVIRLCLKMLHIALTRNFQLISPLFKSYGDYFLKREKA